MDQALAFITSLVASLRALPVGRMEITDETATKYALLGFVVVFVTHGALLAFVLWRWRAK